MPVSDMAELTLPPYRASAGHLITARSHLIDRIVPDCEIIALPAKTVDGGTLQFGRGAMVPRPVQQGLRARLMAPRRGHRPTEGRSTIDLRRNHPDNWAHFLTNHLPVFFRIAEAMEINWTDARLVTPRATPGYIRAAADLFGLTLIATDDVLDGDGVLFDLEPWPAGRSARADWVTMPLVRAAIRRALTGDTALPRRVFLARRATRTIANQAEVEAFLAPYGFQTVYPEDLSAADQVRLFHEAEAMVAIHGAGLAPLLYRQPDSRLKQVIEILPCGHMTDVFRVMAEQVGCAWIGVRGRIKPAYVEPAYSFGTPFKKFSLDAFDVDTESLKRAFEMARYPIGVSSE